MEQEMVVLRGKGEEDRKYLAILRTTGRYHYRFVRTRPA